MRAVSAARGFGRRLVATAGTFDPRGTEVAVGRTLLALAELSVIVLTPDRALFALTGEQPGGARCSGTRALSLWCVGGGSGEGAFLVRRILAVAVLAVVASGYRPRWTCIPHWYVTFSLGASMTLANGGEGVARIATLLLIPICLGDRRRWQWTAPVPPLDPTWRGSAYAAHLTLRVQVVLVYGHAALSKLVVPEWRDGTAVHYVVRDAYYGVPDGLGRLLDPALGSYWFIALATWGTILAEVTIAASALAPSKARRVGLGVAVALHAGIIVFMGLFSFGLVMIALLVLACAGRDPAERPVESPSAVAGGVRSLR